MESEKIYLVYIFNEIKFVTKSRELAEKFSVCEKTYFNNSFSFREVHSYDIKIVEKNINNENELENREKYSAEILELKQEIKIMNKKEQEKAKKLIEPLDEELNEYEKKCRDIRTKRGEIQKEAHKKVADLDSKLMKLYTHMRT